MYIYNIIKIKIVFLQQPVHSSQGSSQPRSFVLAHLDWRLLKLPAGSAKLKPVAVEGGCFSTSPFSSLKFLLKVAEDKNPLIPDTGHASIDHSSHSLGPDSAFCFGMNKSPRWCI